MPRSERTRPVTKPAFPTVSHSAPNPITIQAQKPTMFSAIKDGLGFGIGASIARNIVDSVMKPNEQRPMAGTTAVAGANHLPVTEFKNCMEKTYNNYDECRFHLE